MMTQDLFQQMLCPRVSQAASACVSPAASLCVVQLCISLFFLHSLLVFPSVLFREDAHREAFAGGGTGESPSPPPAAPGACSQPGSRSAGKPFSGKGPLLARPSISNQAVSPPGFILNGWLLSAHWHSFIIRDGFIIQDQPADFSEIKNYKSACEKR